MEKLVIAGCAKLESKIKKWKDYWNNQGFMVTDYPKEIIDDELLISYPKVHKKFFEEISKADILFVMNEKKDNIDGFIGPEMYAEISFGIAQNLINKNGTRIILSVMPSENVYCYDEICLWMDLGWVEVM